MSKLDYIHRLCSCMGDAYQVVWFDFENVIYRDFKNGYEIEISGLANKKRNKIAHLYRWKNRSRVVNQKDVCPVTPEALESTIQIMLKEVSK